VFVYTADAVTTTQYVVKLSDTDGSVVWAAPVSGVGGSGLNFDRCNIKNQTLYVLGGHVLYTIDTSDGSVTNATIGTLTLLGEQISEDVGGSILLDGTWSETTTTPNYIGDYMGTGGDHTIGSGEAGGAIGAVIRFFPGAIGADVAGGGGGGSPPAAPAESRKRCWTFVADGHTFYVLDLGDEGTFVYDITTQQWSSFVTSGFTRWDMLNGVMWGTRVVGGDIDTTDVWEHKATTIQDNDALGIAHVCTGKVLSRDRVYHSVGTVRVAGSLSAIDDLISADINLRYSDDNGKTWSDYFTVTVTPGVYDDVAFDGLGAFKSPGRIFELSDTGGLLRIDGVDAEIDGFESGATMPQSK
jgi:hypothetical protein